MRAISEEKMGRFKVEVELANNNDVVLAQGGHLDPDKVRRVTVQGVVDSGAAYLVLPETVSKQLGLVSHQQGQSPLRRSSFSHT